MSLTLCLGDSRVQKEFTLKKMSEAQLFLSLAPGFSPVLAVAMNGSRFSGFSSRPKPLKRFNFLPSLSPG